MAHHCGNPLFSSFVLNFTCILLLYLCLLLPFFQDAQLTHILEGRVRELAKDAGREKALKDVVVSTSKEKAKAIVTTKKKAAASKKARVLMEKKFLELKVKLGETELKLAKVASLNMAQAEKLADLKATLEACENKWYQKGFTNAENSVEPVINDARKLSFGEGWLAALQAVRVPKDSPLRDPNQIPFLGPTTTAPALLMRRRLQA